MLRHKWRISKLEEKLKDTFHTCKICTVCGMEKLISGSHKNTIEIHSRSNIVFHGNLPECIDYEVENSKIID